MASQETLAIEAGLFEGLLPDKDVGHPREQRTAQSSGILPGNEIQSLIDSRKIWAHDHKIDGDQIQPASLDLRLGKSAHRVRASFLPGGGVSVAERLKELSIHQFDLQPGAVLERDCVYVIELLESLNLTESMTALANPKSSTGRLDVFTRLITDQGETFDRVRKSYKGKLYIEVCPRTFPVKVRTGSRLNQIRFRRRTGAQSSFPDYALSDRELVLLHKSDKIVNGELSVSNGLMMRVDLDGSKTGVVGYKAQRFTNVIDVDQIAGYRIPDFWERIEPTPDKRLILDPHQFYILASKERMRIPADYAAEMVAIDPTMGEFRAHYAGFFDPGFGDNDGVPSARAVLEVRSHEVPFVLEDGQNVGRLVFEKMSKTPETLYGQAGSTNNYQSQGLKLSKHFIAD